MVAGRHVVYDKIAPAVRAAVESCLSGSVLVGEVESSIDLIDQAEPIYRREDIYPFGVRLGRVEYSICVRFKMYEQQEQPKPKTPRTKSRRKK